MTKRRSWWERELLWLATALLFAWLDVSVIYDQWVAPYIHTPQVSFGVALWCFYLVGVVISNLGYLVARAVKGISEIGEYL